MPDDLLWGTEMMFERCPETGKRFSNVMALRTARTKDWESLSEKVPCFTHVCYEDLRQSPQAVIEDISGKFGITKEKRCRPVLTYKGKGEQTYKVKKYGVVSQEDIDYIVQHTDVVLEKSIGYNVEHRKSLLYIEWLEEKLNKQEQFLETIIKGNSFRIGRMITWPIRLFLNRKCNIRLNKYLNG
jgi:hypothetical protein